MPVVPPYRAHRLGTRLLLACCTALVVLATADARAQLGQPEYIAFEHRANGIWAAQEITAFAISPADPTTLYLGGSDGTIYVSVDGGLIWTPQFIDRVQQSFFGSGHPLDWLTLDAVRAADGRRLTRPSSILAAGASLSSTGNQLGEGIERIDSVDDLTARTFDEGLGRTRARRSYTLQGLYGGILRGVGFREYARSRADGVARIAWIACHPFDPDEAIAATNHGVYRTRDRGASWVQIHTAIAPADAHVNHVAYHPHDALRIILSTSGGVFLSADGGESFFRAPDGIFSNARAQWVTFDPTNRDREVFVTGIVRWRSRSEHTSGWLAWAPLRMSGVRQVVFDPSDSDRILVGTSDGLWLSTDGGENFDRANGAVFTGQPIQSIDICPSGGVYLAATPFDVWQSRDAGATWQAISFGAYDGHVVRVAFDLADSSAAWIVGRNSVLRISEVDLWDADPRVLGTYVRWAEAQPTLEQALISALERLRIRRDWLNRYIRRSRVSAWFPRVNVGALVRDIEADAGFRARALTVGAGLDDSVANDYAFDAFAVAITATWDGESAVAGRREFETNQWTHAFHAEEAEILQRVGELYAERARLMLMDLLDRTRDPRTVAMRAVRVRELTNHLDVTTGGVIRMPDPR